MALPTYVSDSTLQAYLQKVRELSVVNQRAISAIIGAAVADAASRPVDWVYDKTIIKNNIGDADPAFWKESIATFNTLPTGRRSCYNDVGYVLLTSLPLSTESTEFSISVFLEKLAAFFQPSSEYGQALATRGDYFDPVARKMKAPVPGPWQLGSVTFQLKQIATGETGKGDPENKDLDGFCAAIPLIARLSTKNAPYDDFASSATTVVKVLAASDASVKRSLSLARVLKVAISEGLTSSAAILEAAKGTDADEDLGADLANVQESLTSGESYVDTVEKFGKACHVPGSYIASVLAVLSAVEAGGYSFGVREGILAGGASCERNNVVGAVLGAFYGIQEITGDSRGIPSEWILKTDGVEEIFELALQRVVTF